MPEELRNLELPFSLTKHSLLSVGSDRPPVLGTLPTRVRFHNRLRAFGLSCCLLWTSNPSYSISPVEHQGYCGKMHKISNFTGQARHGWDRMPAAFGMSRPPPDLSAQQQPLRRPNTGSSNGVGIPTDTTVNLSFNVPFASSLPGPDPEDVLHANAGSFQKWTFPANTEAGTPMHKLPVHAKNIENLRALCRQISDQSGGRIEASVTSAEPKAAPSLQRRTYGLVTNVCISGDGDMVPKIRARILNETPISLVRDEVVPQTFSC